METRKLIEELRKNPITADAVKAAKAPKQAETPVTEAALTQEVTESAEATPAEEAATEPATQPEDAAPEETDADGAGGNDEGDNSIKAPTAKKLRLQLPEHDQVGRMAAAFMQRNRDWTLAQAMEAANKQLGIKPPQQEAAPAQAEQPSNGLPQTTEAVDAQIKQMRADRRKANTELRFEEASDLSDKLEDLIQHRYNLERQADRQQVEQATKYDRDFDSSNVQAVELYPQAADANSDFGKRMLEIEQTLEDTQDPLFNNPKKPLIIAQMVAAEMKIAPRRKGSVVTPAPVKPAAAQVPAKPKVGMVPTGSSRTTAPATNQPPAINTEIKSIRNLTELRAMRAKLGIPNH